MLFAAPSGQGRAIQDLAWVVLFFGVTFTKMFLLKFAYLEMRRLGIFLRKRLGGWRRSPRSKKWSH
jgi:hypothetical protein